MAKFKEKLDACDPETDYIILSGGEPTLHPYIKKMIQVVNARGFKSQIISNGYKILDCIDVLGDMQVNLSLASIGHPDEKDKAVMEVLPTLRYNRIKICISGFYSNLADAKRLTMYVLKEGLNFTMNMPTQLLMPQELANYHVPVEFDINEAFDYCAYYDAAYEYRGDAEWFIEPPTLIKHVARYANKRYWHCKKDTGIEVYYPKAETTKCCLTKVNPEECKGCISTCDLQVDSDYNKGTACD